LSHPGGRADEVLRAVLSPLAREGRHSYGQRHVAADGLGGDVNDERSQRTPTSPQCGGAVYGLGLIGALVWFWQQADGGGERVLGVLKAFAWPAFLVYEAFSALAKLSRPQT
jgi:hypothetical protein